MSTGSSSFSAPDDSHQPNTTFAPPAAYSSTSFAGMANAPLLQNANRAASPTKTRPLDLRAEEEAARRHNIGRAMVSSHLDSNGNTDFFPKNAIRNQLAQLARDNKVTFDDEALSFLAQATESRLRTLLSSTLQAQIHRTTSSHARLPPLTTSTRSKPPRGMWEHEPTSDVNAVLDAINRKNKEAEQTFRASRMDRLARETEVQRAKEKRDEMEIDPSLLGPEGSPDGGPSTPMKQSPAGPSTPHAGGSVPGTPTFGGLSEKKSTYKKSGKKVAVTADVQHKMANATALRSIGFNKKSYSWLSQPAVSSPLAGKKRKADSSKDKDGGGTDDEGNMSSSERVAPVKSSLGPGGVEPRKKRKRPKLSEPSRREVVVERDAGAGERRLTDDRVMTMQDVLFVLERDDVGRSMGSGNHILRKAYALGGFSR